MTLPSSHFQIYITVLKISKIRIQVSYFLRTQKNIYNHLKKASKNEQNGAEKRKKKIATPLCA